MKSPESPAHSPSPLVPEGAGRTPASGPPGRPGIAPPNAALLERVRARDPEALGELYERYFDSVYGLVHRLLGQRAAAEDAASEVFLKVYRAAHQLDVSRDPAPWLMTIATNVCRDLWRSGAYRMSRRSASLEDNPVVAAMLPSGTNDPERALLASEREHLVQEALTQLPEPLRTAIVLHDWQGMSHQDVAVATGIEHAAARKRYSRALSALAKLLKDRLG